MFFRARNSERRRSVRKRWGWAVALGFIGCLLFAGCQANKRASFEQNFSEAQLKFQRGYDLEARQQAEYGFKSAARFPDLEWKFRVLLAEIDVRQERPSPALARLSTEPPATLAFDTRWRFLLTEGLALCKLQKYEDAEERWRTAKKDAGQNPELQTERSLFMGTCELAKGDLENAKSLFHRVEASATTDQFVRTRALIALGWCALLARHYEDAIGWYTRAQQASHVLAAAPFEERALGNLGLSYYELGDFERARKNSLAAEELSGKLGLMNDRMHWLLDVGNAYVATGQYGLAQEYYNKALAVSRQLGNDQIRARALHNLIEIELVQGKLGSADEHQSEARGLKLEGDDFFQFKRDEAGIAASKKDWPSAEHLLLEVLPELKDSPRLTWMVQADLARACAAQQKIQAADQWFQRGIETMENAATNMRQTEFKIAMLGNWPIFDDYIAFLEEQKRPEQALQVAQIARARTLAEQLGFKPQKEDAKSWVRRIQDMLRARKAVILAYYESEHAMYLWAITPKRLLPIKLGVSSNELETLADSYTREIQEHRSLEESVAQQKLYQVLLKPVHEVLPKGTHVILVADSALYRINLEALVSDEGPLHYWIEDAELENASSIDLLLAARHKPRYSKRLLVIGAPQQATEEFPALPHAAEEMESVRKHFPAAQVKSFSGKAATPQAYTSSGPGQFQYIEFATHGKASDSDPMKSSIILSRGANGEFQLYASEIVTDQLKLNADLVTFSACYGAGTVKTSAEGLLGLEWAFLRAGAHQVVAGLWDVNDESVPQIMGGLYEGVVKGQSTSAALRAAKLKMLHTGGPRGAPYYWAPLQVYTGR